MTSPAHDGSVRLRGLSKTFPNTCGQPAVQALKALDLDISNGEFLTLVGPSGSGKTTLLRLLAGLEAVTQGTIEIGGQMVNGVEPKDRGIAMVFQNFALYPHMSVFENMAFGLKVAKKSQAEIRETVLRTAASLGLEQVLERLPQALSGGQRQRVALGRAMVRNPRVFLFDEPLSNLDAPMRVQMRAEIARLHARLRTTMIYVTHDQAEAMTLGDRVCVLHEGALMQVADPRSLYRQPANLFVAGFIGSPPMNLLHGRVQRTDNGLCFVPDGAAPALAIPLKGHAEKLAQTRLDQPLVLGLRPEHLSANASGASPPLTACPIEFVEQTGPDSVLHLKLGEINLAARVYGEQAWKAGDQFPLHLQTEQAQWFDPESGARLDS